MPPKQADAKTRSSSDLFQERLDNQIYTGPTPDDTR